LAGAIAEIVDAFVSSWIGGDNLRKRWASQKAATLSADECLFRSTFDHHWRRCFLRTSCFQASFWCLVER